MAKYYVAVESNTNTGSFLGDVLGFSLKHFEVVLDPDRPINAKRFYDLINKDVEEDYKKTGNVVAWSKIEEE